MLRMSPLACALLVLSCCAVLIPDALGAEAAVSLKKEGKQLVFRSGEREILRYQAEPGELPRPNIKEEFRRGGYIHPIQTPEGRVVTDDYPADHLHHHGIWAPWTKTEFEGRKPDFWNMGAKTGRVEFVALDKTWEENGRAGFTARHAFVDLIANPAKVALNETWEVAVSASAEGVPRHIIDFTSTQTCATNEPLKLPKYHYGGLGFRGTGEWNRATALRALTSEGITDRKKINESRAKWCWIGGEVGGGTAGVTILCHPENYRYPQPIRLHPSEPFFCFAPQQLGEMAIEPGKPYVSRYRFIVTDGEPGSEQAEAWWTEWTAAK